MSFFIRKGVTKRRKPAVRVTNNNIKKKKTENHIDDEISSDSSESNHDDHQAFSSESEEEKFLTVAEKKVQLAKKYLSEIEEEERRRLEDDDDDQVNKNVLKRLKNDVLDQKGKLKTKLADCLLVPTDILRLRNRHHTKAITCIVVSPDDKYAYSASKDSTIIQWDLQAGKVHKCLSYNRKKPLVINPTHHNYPVLSLAVSEQYLVSGDNSGLINVWNSVTLEYIGPLRGHIDGVTGLAICNESNQLFSCSKDKSVKIWDLTELSYIDSLLGHQTEATSIDIMEKDHVITGGGFESMVRMWKIQDETQLMFHGTGGSIDSVKKIDTAHFVTGGDSGCISIWGTLRKKPFCNINNAHGTNKSNGQPNWVSAVGALENSDLIVSGSSDGLLKFWRCTNNYKSILPLFNVPLEGFITGLVFTNDGNRLIVAVANEHRFGRWHTVTGIKNSLHVINLKFNKT
ncbi:WD40/YVTN repeat-like-containing domain,WD40 repeat, conserved site,G-protein beta WD-40 repeat,WD40- [Cinara cedri]|uniref:WD40/YVTN repeat-like-containing domain,WD40 repeat, conserved site,G-protein beta WD-40 repeat,WD40 n=1 Tax=Cinara cedri TaxID=506608 RepID=A0A5E4MDP0_9HEMI|nr:WD40/YVTN repeat-like-containing domain,WD40 repeat, conserved site,G-protein beta WD-40 repeat,WD40- [Cinara cedri]